MKKEIAILLADALESGHYERVSGTNRNDKNQFCIGGVLINLFAQAHPQLCVGENNPRSFMNCSASLPEKVREWAGMNTCFMDTRGGYEIKIGKHNFGGLQTANDSKTSGKFDVSWKEIAAWLRVDSHLKHV